MMVSHFVVFAHTMRTESTFLAIKILTQRHGILRSTFHGANDIHPKPFIAEDDPSCVTPLIQTVILPGNESSEKKVFEWLHTPVDLSTQYAARWIAVISKSETDVYLVAHHIALDGASMSILASEMFAIMDAEARAGADLTVPKLAPISQPFNQAHLLERAYMSAESFHAAEAFWLSQLSGVNPLRWRTQLSQPSSRNYREIQTWGTFSKEVRGLRSYIFFLVDPSL
jgi:hypothetical protein